MTGSKNQEIPLERPTRVRVNAWGMGAAVAALMVAFVATAVPADASAADTSTQRTRPFYAIDMPYLTDMGSGYLLRTDKPAGPTGKIWVAYELKAISQYGWASERISELDEPAKALLEASSVDVDVKAGTEEASPGQVVGNDPGERLSYGESAMVKNPVTNRQLMDLRVLLENPPYNARAWQQAAISILGEDGYQSMLKQMGNGDAHKRQVYVREYQVEAGKPVLLAVSPHPPEGMLPIYLSVAVGHGSVPDDLFVKLPSGEWEYKPEDFPWFKRNKAILGIGMALVLLVGMRVYMRMR